MNQADLQQWVADVVSTQRQAVSTRLADAGIDRIATFLCLVNRCFRHYKGARLPPETGGSHDLPALRGHRSGQQKILRRLRVAAAQAV
jgi:hypothetical protein